MTARRLHQLFVPGGDVAAIAAAPASGADVLFYDLEDAVGPEGKDAARRLVRDAVTAVDGGRPTLVRINPLDGAWGHDDLVVVAAGPTALVLPKITSAEEVREADRQVRLAEVEHGREPGTTGLYVMLELPDAVLRAREILGASASVEGAIFGVADFMVSLGVPAIRGGEFRLPSVVESAYAMAIMAAAAAGVRCVGVPLAPLDDRDKQLTAYRHLLELGFDGLMAGSAGAVALVEEAARPDPADAGFARGVVETAARGEADGERISFHDGWFVEGPFIELAEQLLERQR